MKSNVDGLRRVNSYRGTEYNELYVVIEKCATYGYDLFIVQETALARYYQHWYHARTLGKAREVLDKVEGQIANREITAKTLAVI